MKIPGRATLLGQHHLVRDLHDLQALTLRSAPQPVVDPSLLETSASLVVTSALLVVTRSY